jgi:hypothetical protein
MIPIEYFVGACVVFVIIMVRQYFVNKELESRGNAYETLINVIAEYVNHFGTFNIEEDGSITFEEEKDATYVKKE